MTVVTTSTASTSTAYSNQRKIDRTQNGVLWAMYWDGTSNTTSSMHFRYSTDNGATWSDGGGFGFAGTGTTYVPNGSLFIDVDDYAHVAYKDRSDGFIYYRRGTPNAGRTAWAWSAATPVHGTSASANHPDIVAHREGGGWTAHVVYSFTDNANYSPVTIASGGGVTVGSSVTLAGTFWANGVHKFPSIDFNHTGDGKTVKGGTPHLYAAWSAGAAGAGKGIRFRKATYSGGSWTWGTEREIDNDKYIIDDQTWLNCVFDGTRVAMAGLLYSTSFAHRRLMIYERDVSDTTTTPRDVRASAAGSLDPVWRGSASWDDSGSVFFCGLTINATTKKVGYRKWDRGSGTLGDITYLADCEQNYLSAKRGYSGNRIELVYTDGAASPYSITYAAVDLNEAPNAPSLTAPADSATLDRNSTQRFDWDFSDPDAGDTQSKYDLRYRAVGAGTWTLVTGTTPNTYHDFVGGTFAAGDYEWQARTYDARGAVGPYSGSSFFMAGNAPEEPTITDPINGATIGNTQEVAWSTPDQDGYQIRRVADNGGTADGTTVYYDSGEQVTATTRSHTLTFETNNRYEHIQVRQKRDGLWSQWASVRVLVAYTRPPTPLVSLLADAGVGSLVVTVTNPAPGAGEPAVNYNDIYVDDGDGEFRAATLVVPNSSWTYWLPRAQHDYAGNVRVVAVADNGTTASS